MNSLQGRRVLVFRNDRIGDLVLALPLIQALKQAGAYVGVLASPYASPLLEGDPRVDSLLLDGPGALKKIKAGRYDSGVLLWANWRNALLAWRGGLGLRIGPTARPFSWLQNASLPIRRSKAEKSEAEYNLDHLAPLGLAPALERAPLYLDPQGLREAKAWLKARGLAKGSGPLIALHPGTGGSSLRWPLDAFAALGESLRRELGARLIISGGPGDGDLVRGLARSLRPVAALDPPLGLKAYAALLGQLDVFVSAATGPMHMAGAAGAATVSFFPPVRPMAASRWHPLSEPRAVLSPLGLGTPCPRCRGEACPLYDCMRSLGPQDALAAVRTVLALKGRAKEGKR